MNSEEREIQKKEFIESIKNIEVGNICFKYGNSKKENRTYNDFTLYNKKVKIVSDRVFDKISEEEYCKEEAINLIKNEYRYRDILVNTKENWCSVEELWEYFENNNINIVSFEIQNL